MPHCKSTRKGKGKFSPLAKVLHKRSGQLGVLYDKYMQLKPEVDRRVEERGEFYLAGTPYHNETDKMIKAVNKLESKMMKLRYPSDPEKDPIIQELAHYYHHGTNPKSTIPIAKPMPKSKLSMEGGAYKLRKAPKRDAYWVVGMDGRKHSKEPLPLETAKKQIIALNIAMSKEGGGKYSDELASRMGAVIEERKISDKLDPHFVSALREIEKGAKEKLKEVGSTFLSSSKKGRKKEIIESAVEYAKRFGKRGGKTVAVASVPPPPPPPPKKPLKEEPSYENPFEDDIKKWQSYIRFLQNNIRRFEQDRDDTIDFMGIEGWQGSERERELEQARYDLESALIELQEANNKYMAFCQGRKCRKQQKQGAGKFKQQLEERADDLVYDFTQRYPHVILRDPYIPDTIFNDAMKSLTEFGKSYDIPELTRKKQAIVDKAISVIKNYLHGEIPPTDAVHLPARQSKMRDIIPERQFVPHAVEPQPPSSRRKATKTEFEPKQTRQGGRKRKSKLRGGVRYLLENGKIINKAEYEQMFKRLQDAPAGSTTHAYLYNKYSTAKELPAGAPYTVEEKKVSPASRVMKLMVERKIPMAQAEKEVVEEMKHNPHKFTKGDKTKKEKS